MFYAAQGVEPSSVGGFRDKYNNLANPPLQTVRIELPLLGEDARRAGEGISHRETIETFYPSPEFLGSLRTEASLV